MNIKTNGFGKYVEIAPIKAVFNDVEMSSQLAITSVIDNMTYGIINWELRSADVQRQYDNENNIIIEGTAGSIRMKGTYTMTNGEYEQWGADNDYLYSLLGAIPGIEIL